MFLNSIPQTPNLILCTLQKAFSKKKKKKKEEKKKKNQKKENKIWLHDQENVAQTHWQDDEISYKRRKISKKQFCYNHSLRKYIQLSLRKVKKIHAIYITSSKTVSKILQSTWNCARKNSSVSKHVWLVKCQYKKYFWLRRMPSLSKKVEQPTAPRKMSSPVRFCHTLARLTHNIIRRLHLILKAM